MRKKKEKGRRILLWCLVLIFTGTIVTAIAYGQGASIPLEFNSPPSPIQFLPYVHNTISDQAEPEGMPAITAVGAYP